MDIKFKIASMLVAYRYANKQSQKQVSEKLNVTHQQVQKYEKMDNELSAIRLIQFCDAYEIDLNMFQNGDPFQVLDGADISILKKEKAIMLIDKLEEKAHDKSRSDEDMVGESISERTHL
jgi:transcriptional regulator with XRE-family HTH domain